MPSHAKTLMRHGDPPPQVVLPLGAGQWLRACHHSVGEKADAWKPQLGTLASFTLLVIIYTTFCNTFCQVCKSFRRECKLRLLTVTLFF